MAVELFGATGNYLFVRKKRGKRGSLGVFQEHGRHFYLSKRNPLQPWDMLRNGLTISAADPLV